MTISKAEAFRRTLFTNPIKKNNRFKLSELNINWVNKLDKTINNNGCWISKLKAHRNGYVDITIENKVYQLSRLVICIYYSLNYNDISWDTRHGKDCDKACFNIEHLEYGTKSDNMKDKIRDGTNYELNKKVCPKCGGEYRIRINKTGQSIGKTCRYCPICQFMK